jgi:hypothetical protein
MATFDLPTSLSFYPLIYESDGSTNPMGVHAVTDLLFPGLMSKYSTANNEEKGLLCAQYLAMCT